MSHKPYVHVCEWAVSGKLRRLSDSSLSGIGSSASEIMPSVGDGASNVNGVSSLDSVGEDKSAMLNTYSSPLPINPRWYELSLDTCRSGDLSLAPSRGE